MTTRDEVVLVSHMDLPDGVRWSKNGWYLHTRDGWRWVCGLIEPHPSAHRPPPVADYRAEAERIIAGAEQARGLLKEAADFIESEYAAPNDNGDLIPDPKARRLFEKLIDAHLGQQETRDG